jgi:hypothetical protein
VGWIQLHINFTPLDLAGEVFEPVSNHVPVAEFIQYLFRPSGVRLDGTAWREKPPTWRDSCRAQAASRRWDTIEPESAARKRIETWDTGAAFTTFFYGEQVSIHG